MNKKLEEKQRRKKQEVKLPSSVEPLTLVVKIRKWTPGEERIFKYVYEFSETDKYAKITRGEDGCVKVFVDVGFAASPKAGLLISGEGIVIPPEGLIIKL